ncbi:NAD(FAD)-utilizing dehydrogenase [Brevundimonas sp. GN22]|uniref:TIGR03862 family flavoprotein n=1 Tax=Brevundimonas pishanensis TaxID=2896315 RepID=UPI001FA7C317|nr:TIGR03862 family flavoprotein [Brevundimonas pishanensis]
MNATPPPSSRVVIIGAGPAGLMAAEQLADQGHDVTVHDQMPSVARKFLMAGRGGLNLTHSEPRERFDRRYGEAQPQVADWLDDFDAQALRTWADGLGAETFIGTSGRVFPKAMKASPLLRAWLARLARKGVTIKTRSRWTGWHGDALAFDELDGSSEVVADAVILALGGASWVKLGSDAAWVPWLNAKGVDVRPFQPANVGFEVDWSPLLVERFAGHPLKNIGITFSGHTARGEAILSGYGLEGGAVYALSAVVREAIARQGEVMVHIDLRPDQTLSQLANRLDKPRGKNSLSNHLRKSLHLDPAFIGLMREAGPLPEEAMALAQLIKAVPVRLKAPRGLERAISSAGGIGRDQYNRELMLNALPGVFVCGEMLDWEAPTGGYLLQACFASAVRASRGVQRYLVNAQS